MQRHLQIIAFLVCMFAPLCCAQTKTYNDPEGRYSFTIPDGWQQAPQSQVDYLNDLNNSRTPDSNYEFILAFSPDADIFHYPYVLLQETRFDTSQTTYEELAAGFNAELMNNVIGKSTERWSDALASASASSAVVEPESNSFSMTFNVQTQASQTVRGLSFGKFTNSGLYQLNAYIPIEEVESSANIMEAVRSLTIESSIAFVPRQPHQTTSTTSRAYGAAAILVVGAIATLTFGSVIIFVIWKLSRPS